MSLQLSPLTVTTEGIRPSHVASRKLQHEEKEETALSNAVGKIQWDSLLQKCTSLIRMKQLQAHLITTGKFQFHPSRTKLLELCAISPAGDLSFAAQIFRRIQTPSTNDWNAVLRGMAQSPEPAQALSWFHAMSRSPQKVDALTCSFALKGCARALAFSEATQIHSQLLRFGFIEAQHKETQLFARGTPVHVREGAGELATVVYLFQIITARYSDRFVLTKELDG
ncbi:Pentatricopeptide repeat-containing protein [Spatholobus suberectus]|nr:Pentatricopeptide repeat-containing protein [Spatholobus suberectus]